MLPKNIDEALAVFSQVRIWKELDEADKMMYQGCEGNEPRIAEVGDVVVIRDVNPEAYTIAFLSYEGEYDLELSGQRTS